MNLLTAILRALGWPPPAVHVPTRPRLLRCTCEFCGKDVAVVRSSGKLWAHRCRPPVQPDEEPAHVQHDTWDEHRGER